MHFRPRNGIVICHRKSPRSATPGGIILPDTAQKRSELATVLEVCIDGWIKDGRDRTTTLKPGDLVVISKYSGEEVEIDLANGGTLTVVSVKEDDIRFVIESDEPVSVDAPAAAVPAISQFWGDGLPNPAPIA